MPEETDWARLVTAVRNREDHAFQELEQLIHTRFWGYLLTHANTREDAEDIYSKVLVAVWKDLGKLNQPERLVSYVFTIVKNRIADHYRGGQQRAEKAVELTHDLVSGDLPEATLMMRERLAALHGCIDALPEQMRELIVLHHLGGVSLQEIADLTDKPLNTIKTHHRRAKIRLADCLTHKGYHPGGANAGDPLVD